MQTPWLRQLSQQEAAAVRQSLTAKGSSQWSSQRLSAVESAVESALDMHARRVKLERQASADSAGPAPNMPADGSTSIDQHAAEDSESVSVAPNADVPQQTQQQQQQQHSPKQLEGEQAAAGSIMTDSQALFLQVGCLPQGAPSAARLCQAQARGDRGVRACTGCAAEGIWSAGGCMQNAGHHCRGEYSACLQWVLDHSQSLAAWCQGASPCLGLTATWHKLTAGFSILCSSLAFIAAVKSLAGSLPAADRICHTLT